MTKKPPEILDLAAKQRHLHLLEKVRRSQALRPSELAELEAYERGSAESKEISKPKARAKQARRLSLADAQRLGFQCRCIADADQASKLAVNLAQYLMKHPRLRAAFDRGRLLRKLVELAPNAQVHEAARQLKNLGFKQFESGQSLRDFLDQDPEANELWETARVNGSIENRQACRKTAGDGNVQAIKLIEKWAADRQREIGQRGVSFNRVSVKEMAELFGTTRQTIHQWYTEKGLPQNSDGTFDLAVAIPWYQDFVLKKAVRGKDAISPLNPQQAIKTKVAELNYQQMLGELVERGAVLGFHAAMMQNIVNAFNSIADLANRCFGQPREQIVERLEDFRDEVMAKLQHVPPELKLSPQARAKLAELYEIIKPKGGQKQ